MRICLHDAIIQGMKGRDCLDRATFTIGGESLNDNEWADVSYAALHEWNIPICPPPCEDCNKYIQEIQTLKEKNQILETELKVAQETITKQQAQKDEEFFANQPLDKIDIVGKQTESEYDRDL